MDNCQNRLHAIQAQLVNYGLEGLLLSSPDSIAYFAGFTGYLGIEFGRPTLVYIPAVGEASIITPLMESEMVSRQTWIEKIEPWEDGVKGEWHPILSSFLVKEVSQLGVEAGNLPPFIAAYLERAHPKLKRVDATPFISELRMIKSADEIEIMRQAGQVGIAMVEAARSVIAEGVPEYEIALAVIEGGSRKAAGFLGSGEQDLYISPMIHNLQILQSGEHTCMVHRRASVRQLQKGDPVYLCFCGMIDFRHYRLGFDREFFIETASDQQLKAYEVCLAAQGAALAAIKPGAIAEEVHFAANEVYQQAGFSPGYRTGRGVGYSYIEHPEFKAGDQTVLRPGMTFAVDGGITFEGEFGARVGDSVVVTEDGYEMLTPYPKSDPVI